MLLARETRCGPDEVRHFGAVAIASDIGTLLYGHEPPTAIPLRSTAKPFFLGALLKTVLQSESFTLPELAVMSSSHNGEPQHVTVITELLTRYGLSPEHVRCGIHTKWREWSINSPLGNNCSGK